MLATIEKQQLLHEYIVELLTQQIEVKFGSQPVTRISDNLSRLTLNDLQLLAKEIFRLKNLEQLGMWLETRSVNEKGNIAKLMPFVGILSDAEATELNQIIDLEFETNF